METEQLDHTRYKIALAGANLTQAKAAQRIGVASSTLSGWVTGATRPPDGWVRRLETALGLGPGQLAAPVQDAQVTP